MEPPLKRPSLLSKLSLPKLFDGDSFKTSSSCSQTVSAEYIGPSVGNESKNKKPHLISPLIKSVSKFLGLGNKNYIVPEEIDGDCEDNSYSVSANRKKKKRYHKTENNKLLTYDSNYFNCIPINSQYESSSRRATASRSGHRDGNSSNTYVSLPFNCPSP